MRGDSEKEREHADLESDASVANRNLQVAEATLSSLKSQLKAKQDEAKGKQRVAVSRSASLMHVVCSIGQEDYLRSDFQD